VKLSDLYDNEKRNKNTIQRIMQMTEIAGSANKAINHHYNEQQIEVQKELKRLNRLYDGFIKTYGFINDKRNYGLMIDSPDATLLCALENWDSKNKSATKADIFQGINFAKATHITHYERPIDAMVLSLTRYGNINIPFMESITGINRDVLTESLLKEGKIYPDPEEFENGRMTYLASDLYLSGNVREKLRKAEAAVEKDTLFTGNVYLSFTKILNELTKNGCMHYNIR
jgi:N12 class adenine-specific DNA methylase